MDKEIWKDVRGFEGKYQISSFGRLKSIIHTSKGTREKFIAKPKIGKYSQCKLTNKEYELVCSIHELVAFMFLDYVKTDRKTCINHINGEKSDNRVENIEIVSASYNVKDGFNRGRKAKNKYIKLMELNGVEYSNYLINKINKKNESHTKTIYMYDLDMNYIDCFSTSIEAEEKTGIKANNIRGYISSGRKYTCKGRIFKHELIEKGGL